jgi:hypothetical protein
LANGINLINQTTPDYSRTDAEIAAGITPVDLHYPPGDIRRYGAQGGGADDRAAIQAAIDGSVGANEVYIPPGEWIVGAALQWRTGTIIRGAGIDQTVIKLSDDADVHANVLEPAEKDGSVVYWRISDLTLDGNYSRTSGTGSARPRGNCLATMGASYGLIERVRATGAVVHGFDICNGGEGSDYVTPEHSADPTYYPANMSRFIVMRDCIGEDAGDDAITTHYCQYIWIERCIGRNAGYRHSSEMASNGIEVDDASMDVWVIDCLAYNVARGYAAKTHPPRPAPRRVHFINCVAERVNTGFYLHKSGTSTLGEDIVVVNPVVRNPAQNVDPGEVPLTGIHVRNAPKVFIRNPIIHAPPDTTLTLDAAILSDTGAGTVIIEGGSIDNWPNATSGSFRAAIHNSSSVQEVRIHGTRINNPGWRGITFSHASGGILRVRDVDIIGQNLPNSIGLWTAADLADIDIEVSGVTVRGFTSAVQYGSLASASELEVKRGSVLLGGKLVATSSGSGGGSGSAGAGNQYVELTIGGTTYKVLHDGVI